MGEPLLSLACKHLPISTSSFLPSHLQLYPSHSRTIIKSNFFKSTSDQTKLPSQWIPSRTPPSTSSTPSLLAACKYADQSSSFVGDKVNEATSGASKEANKNVAKDSDASVGTRASAAKDALGDKVDESKNSASAEGNKQAATH